ncbi:MAG: DUF4349 domain-containing protein [Actinomycetia bacterium]|nr:DUF4349 domain-containing protein [Actinomycetes bacterium]
MQSGSARATTIAAGLNAVGPKIIQEASISLAVEEGGFELAISKAREAALAARGFVTSSEARQAETEERLVHGKFVARVPFLRYSTVLSQIIGLGTVEAREEAGRDVSQQFVDLEARGRHLGGVETQLPGFLGDADSIGDALTMQSRLNEVQLQLEQIRGQLRFLENQPQYATISIASPSAASCRSSRRRQTTGASSMRGRPLPAASSRSRVAHLSASPPSHRLWARSCSRSSRGDC